MPMTIRIGAAHYDLTVKTPKGKSTYDLSHMTPTQLEGVRELVVNWFCRERGQPEVYNNA